MTQKTVNTGEFYKHFKGQLYQVRALAENSEDNTPMVVYQAMYAPFKIWVRPLSTFLEKLDKEKYPDAAQEYRFERIILDDRQNTEAANCMSNSMQSTEPLAKSNIEQKSIHQAGTAAEPDIVQSEKSAAVTNTIHPEEAITVSDEEITDALLSGQVERKLSGKISDNQLAAKGLMIFLDAENYHDKRHIFSSLEPYLNDTMLNNIAVTLDLVLDEGSKEQHFETILNCLETHEHYECNRLR